MGFPGRSGHPIPGCFVCGTERGPGDGLCIYPGESPHRDVAVAEWVPDEEYADEHGHVWRAIHLVGARLPQLFRPRRAAAAGVAGPAVGTIERPVTPGERLTHHRLGNFREGRKHHSATVIHGEAGEVVAVARALWIEVDKVPA